MKKLTLDLYRRIIDTFHEQTRNNLKLLGHVTPEECAEYIGFYAYHGGLFWCERNGKIAAVATAHPSKKHFDWEWMPEDGVWTTHCVWASDKASLAELIRQLLQTYSVKQFHACRRGSLTHLNAKKLERILFYGRIRCRRTVCTEDSKIRQDDDSDFAGASKTCPGNLAAGGAIPAKVSSVTSADAGAIGAGSDEAIPGASTSILPT